VGLRSANWGICITAVLDCLYSKVYGYIAVSSVHCHAATVTHMPYGITQCYLPLGRGDIPALTPAEAGTRFSDPGVMHG